jgi:type II secretory pathway component PulF
MASNYEEGRPLHEKQLAALLMTVESTATNRLPLEVTLAALAEDADDRRLAAVARKLAADLHKGATISEAMSHVGDRLPAEVRGLFRAGVESGDLAGTFNLFARERAAQVRIQRRIRAAVFYPIAILCILTPLVLLLSLVVIPSFRPIFVDFDLVLPETTVALMQAADFMPAIIGGALLVLFGLPLALRMIGGRWIVDRVRPAVPLLGPLWSWSGQREFAAMLGSFIEVRLPTMAAVAYTSEILNDRNVARACLGVNERMQGGESLSNAMSNSIHFDRALISLVKWGEDRGLLPEALRVASAIFTDRIEQHASLVQRMLPPIMLIVVGVGVLFVVIGLMLPLVSLIEGLSQ